MQQQITFLHAERAAREEAAADALAASDKVQRQITFLHTAMDAQLVLLERRCVSKTSYPALLRPFSVSYA